MTRTLKLGALALVIVGWLLFSQALYAAPGPEHTVATVEVAGVCAGSTWTPRITITRDALRELRDRMARYERPMGICITGPYEEDCRAPSSLEEAWLLEKLYGRAPRWVLDIVPLRELVKPALDPGELFWVAETYGLRAGIHTTKTVSHLRVELCRDAIRVYEYDV